MGSLFGMSSRDHEHHPLKKTIQQHLSKSPSKNRRASSAVTAGGSSSTITAPTVTVVQETTIQRTGLLTRNHTSSDPLQQKSSCNDKSRQRSLIWDAIASASIVSNATGIDTSMNKVLSLDSFTTFLRVYQREEGLTPDKVKAIIDRHEPDAKVRQSSCLSFEGFACYLMDKDNYAFTPETNSFIDEDLNETLSHYYLASSHNTYLTGHQLKGESSVELYAQVLRTGCRCVELDCWDGEDGFPVIYHGHTLTSKISFKRVIEAIASTAFESSPFPVILSLENHCSLSQQSKMAQIFLSIFGDKLVTRFMFDSDFTDDPRLPSPNQLRYKILIKNKKLRAPLIPHIQQKIKQAVGMAVGSSSLPASSSASTPGSVHRQPQPNRTNSLLSVDSSGSLNDDDEDSDDEDEEDDDLIASPATDRLGKTNTVTTITAATTPLSTSSVPFKISTASASSVSYEASSSTHCPTEFPLSLLSMTEQHHQHQATGHQGNDYGNKSHPHHHYPHYQSSQQQHKISSTPAVLSQGKDASGRKSSQVAPELSDLVNYVQAVKFRGLFFDSVSGLITSRQPNQQLQQQQQQQSQQHSSQKELQLSRQAVVGASASSSSLLQSKKSSGGSGKKLAVGQSVIQSSSPANTSSLASVSTVTIATTTTTASTCNASLVTTSFSSTESNSLVTSLPSSISVSKTMLSSLPVVSFPSSESSSCPSSSGDHAFHHHQQQQQQQQQLVQMMNPSVLEGDKYSSPSSCLVSPAASSLSYAPSTTVNLSIVSSGSPSVTSLIFPTVTTTTCSLSGNQQPLPFYHSMTGQNQQTSLGSGTNLSATSSSIVASSTVISSATSASSVSTVTATNLLQTQQQFPQLSEKQATTGNTTSSLCLEGKGQEEAEDEDKRMTSQKYANPLAPCYQVPSLNEHTAKKLCRKSPLPVISFTESQLMRSYPAGMRIDSSNFNPLTFWAFGLQMAAINYQTDDIGSAINTAFFEQNGSVGLVKKPAVMIDQNHVMFGRFNPWEKEFDGLYALDLTVTVTFLRYTLSSSPLPIFLPSFFMRLGLESCL